MSDDDICTEGQDKLVKFVLCAVCAVLAGAALWWLAAS